MGPLFIKDFSYFNRMKLINKSNILELWQNADCVCFDVDSTVCRNEAIDDLAEFANVGTQVQQM